MISYSDQFLTSTSDDSDLQDLVKFTSCNTSGKDSDGRVKNGDKQPDQEKDFSKFGKGDGYKKAEEADDKGCHKENDGEKGKNIFVAHVHNLTVDESM